MSGDGTDRAAPADDSTVFVSYAHEDRSFVTEQLMPALRARGKHPWIDVDSIEPAADWRDRVTRGIANSNAFVFVLSPDSVDSRVCADEARQAAELNKRVVPVCRRDLGEDTHVPPAVERWNWVWMRDGDDLEHAIAEVMDALETDLEWRDAHTRLAIRAREWRAGGRDASFVLRGRDLEAAEAWLNQQGEHRERPTALHVEFIRASREAATKRQRRIVGAATAAVVVSLTLAGLALWQRGVAVHQRDEAQARELATVSVAVVKHDPELALLLAREGMRTTTTPEGTDALRIALLRNRVLQRLRHGASVYSAVFAGKSNTVATAGRDGTVQLWDARNGRRRA